MEKGLNTSTCLWQRSDNMECFALGCTGTLNGIKNDMTCHLLANEIGMKLIIIFHLPKGYCKYSSWDGPNFYFRYFLQSVYLCIRLLQYNISLFQCQYKGKSDKCCSANTLSHYLYTFIHIQSGLYTSIQKEQARKKVLYKITDLSSNFQLV